MKIRINLLILSLLLTLSGCGRGAEIVQGKSCDNLKQIFYSQDWESKPAERVVALESLKVDCGNKNDFIVMLSYSYYMAGNYDETTRFIEKKYSLSSESDKPQLLYYQFYSYLFLENAEKSKEVADNGVKNFPKHYMGYLLEGLYFQNKEDWINAIPYFEKANTIQEDFEAYSQLTVAYYNTNRFPDSVTSYFRGLKLDNNAVLQNTPANLTAAASLYQLGRYEEAKQILANHVATVPESASNKDILKLNALLMQKSSN